MAKIHGKNATVYLSSGSGAAVPITQAAEWSISIGAAFDKAAVFGDTFDSALKGLMNWSGAINGNFDTAQTTLFAAMTAQAVQNFYLYPSASASGQYYYGTIWVKSLALGGSTTAKTTSKMGFDGDGVLSAN